MFLDTAFFSYLRPLEREWRAIRDEGLALPAELVRPWVERHLYDEGWSLAFVAVMGRAVPELAALCPRTAELVTAIPGLGMAAFSRLAPGARVEPHSGFGDRVYRFHVGLVTPQGCGIEVAGEERGWSEGRSLGFDDTLLHSAWNGSDRERWVLMLDVLRPGRSGAPYDLTQLAPEVRALALSLGVGNGSERPAEP